MPVRGQKAKRELIDNKRVEKRAKKAALKAANNGKWHGRGRTHAPSVNGHTSSN